MLILSHSAVGDLSYPLFLSHWLSVFIILSFFPGWGINEPKFFCMSLITSLLLSIVTHYFVERPISTIRNRLRSGNITHEADNKP